MEIIRELPPLQEATTKAATLAEENAQLRSDLFAAKKRLERAQAELRQAQMATNAKAREARKSRALWQAEYWKRQRLERVRSDLKIASAGLLVMTIVCFVLYFIIVCGGAGQLVRWLR